MTRFTPLINTNNLKVKSYESRSKGLSGKTNKTWKVGDDRKVRIEERIFNRCRKQLDL